MPFTIKFSDGKHVAGESPLSGLDAMVKLGLPADGSVVAWKVNNYERPLEWTIENDSEAEFINATSSEGLRIYSRSLDFLFVIACSKVMNRKVILRHSINEEHYWEFADGDASQSDAQKLRETMEELVRQNVPFVREVLPIDKAKRIFETQGEPEIADLFVKANIDPVEVYRCGEQYGYFGGVMVPSTGALKTFNLVPFAHGLVLQYPTAGGIRPFNGTKSQVEVFSDYARWLKALDLNYLSHFHRHVTAGRSQELILISEAFHSQRLSLIAEKITSMPKVKVVAVTGPSGSGKTTFSERLKIQLIVCGKTPVTLPMDNYFLDRDEMVKDENNEYDFEAPEALDLKLLKDHLARILNGEEVLTPRFNFPKGKKEQGKTIQLGKEDVLIIEGIHGLNERFLDMLPEDQRFTVFVSPLTGICIDPHNRTGTGDNRLLRRLIRDARTRGKSAEVTLEMYPKVKKGAMLYIFPTQNRADMIFNSSLPYELGVLKGYVEPLLHTVPEKSPFFREALRLLNILKFVPSIHAEGIPNNSVIREFIGGSCLDV